MKYQANDQGKIVVCKQYTKIYSHPNNQTYNSGYPMLRIKTLDSISLSLGNGNHDPSSNLIKITLAARCDFPPTDTQ